MRAVQITLAESAARSQRDLRLDNVVTRTERVGAWIEERQYALSLIAVQKAPIQQRTGHHTADSQRHRAYDVAHAKSRQHDHHDSRGDDEQSGAEIRLPNNQ